MARELAGAALQVGAEPLAEAAQRLEQALNEVRQPAELRELCARVADEQAYLRWAWEHATAPAAEQH